MEIFMLATMLLLFISIIVYIILRLLSRDPITGIVGKITLCLFAVFVVSASFFPFEGFIVAIYSILVAFMIAAWIAILWKLLLNEDIKAWLYSWMAFSMLVLITAPLRYKDDSVIGNISDFGIMVLFLMYIVTVACMLRKNEYGRILTKATGVFYAVNAVLFSITPPCDPVGVIACLIVAVVAGFIPAFLMIYIYKKRYSSVDRVSKIMDEV